MAVLDKYECGNEEECRKLIRQLAEQGFIYKPKMYKNRLYLYNAGDDSICISAPKDVDLLSIAKEELEKYKKGEEHEHGKSRSSTIGKRYTLEALDRSHARIVRNIVETVEWFTDVLHDIGFYATIIAMQLAKVPPEELYDKIKEFKDPKEFVDFVKQYLIALLEAKEDAEIITHLRERIDMMDAKLILLKECYNKIKNQRDELVLVLNTAVSSMCDDCLKRFLLSYMTVRYGVGAVGGGIGGRFVGGADSGEEGNTEGEGSSYT